METVACTARRVTDTLSGRHDMHIDPRVEAWAQVLEAKSWDNIDELAEIIVAEINAEED
jgi:hypothetical protein